MPETNEPETNRLGPPRPAKVAVSMSDMARVVGLSRTYFAQLVKSGVFPPPERSPRNGRPYFNAAAQAACLEVRRTNLGHNGQAVLFYAKHLGSLDHSTRKSRTIALRAQSASSRKKKNSPPPPKPKHAALIEALGQLGLNGLTEAKVGNAVAECFPNGVGGQLHESVLISVFRHLECRNSGGNHGR